MAVTERLSGADPRSWARQLVSVLAVLAVWALVTNLGFGWFPNLPSPLTVGETYAESVVEPSFWGAAAVSTARIYVSFVLAAAIAIPLGLLIGWSVIIADLVSPALETLRPVPPVAWIPVVALVLPIVSLGVVDYPVDTGILFITFLGAFFPILLNAVQGVRDLDTEYERAAESLGTSPGQTFRHVIYPGALPSIHAGMINGMGLAWVNLVAAEMIAGSGLGYLTWSSYIAGDYATIVVGMTAIGVLGYLSSLLVRWLGASQLPWLETTGG